MITKQGPRSLGVGTIWKFGPLRALLASLHAWFLALVAVLADTKWWSRERNDPPRHAYKARILPIKLQDQSGAEGGGCNHTVRALRAVPPTLGLQRQSGRDEGGCNPTDTLLRRVPLLLGYVAEVVAHAGATPAFHG